MKPVTSRRMQQLLRERGWILDRSHGSHLIYTHPLRRAIVTVPNHAGDLTPSTQLSIMKIAGIGRDEL